MMPNSSNNSIEEVQTLTVLRAETQTSLQEITFMAIATREQMPEAILIQIKRFLQKEEGLLAMVLVDLMMKKITILITEKLLNPTCRHQKLVGIPQIEVVCPQSQLQISMETNMIWVLTKIWMKLKEV